MNRNKKILKSLFYITLTIIIVNCKEDNSPSVTTDNVSGLTLSSAILQGKVLSDGGSPITAQGFVISSHNSMPYLTDSIIISDDESYLFSFLITNLDVNKTYYFRAFVSNFEGTGFGNVSSFSVDFSDIRTGEVLHINSNKAVCEGIVQSIDSLDVSLRGICWNINHDPTLKGDHTKEGKGGGKFISYLTGLSSGTKYFVRAYIIKNIDTLYGNEVNFTTRTKYCDDSILYYGKIYHGIVIGEQCWFKENLDVGQMIDSTFWPSNNQLIEKFCYNNLEDNCTKYGGLYSWDEAMQYSIVEGNQGICPNGWHIPTDKEWINLEGSADSQYGVNHSIWSNYGARGSDVAFNLATGEGWEFSYKNTNKYGFSALPGGCWIYPGRFSGLLSITAWFTSNRDNPAGWYNWENINRGIQSNDPAMYRSRAYSDLVGYSVRCIKDK